MDINSDAPRLFAHSAVAQGIWLLPAAAGTVVADSPTAAVVAYAQASAGTGLAVGSTAQGKTSVGCC